MTGSLPDPNLSLDLFDLVGRLRRSANTASRFGQVDELNRLADEVLRWQIHLHKAVIEALGSGSLTEGWNSVIAQISEMRHERDGAQMLHKLDVERSGEK